MSKSDHFYTTNVTEANAAIQNPHYQLEGVECFVFTQPQPSLPGLVPVYRYFDVSDHFYTTDKNEGDHAKGYHYENVAFYIHKAKPAATSKLKWIPLFRMFGTDSRDHEHFYTTAQDRSAAKAAKYVDEGIIGYVLAEIPPKPYYAAPLIRLYKPSHSDGIKLKDVFSFIKDAAEVISAVGGVIIMLTGGGAASKKDPTGTTVFSKDPQPA